MSGVGKWIKKNPLQAAGLLAGAAVGGPALIGLLSPAAAAPASAALLGDAELALAGSQVAGAAGADAAISAVPLAKVAYDVPQYAALANTGPFTPTTPGAFDKMGAFADKMGPYAKVANMGMSLMDQGQPQAPQIAPPQLRGPGQALSPAPQYGMPSLDPEEERRRMMLAMLMGQQSGVA